MHLHLFKNRHVLVTKDEVSGDGAVDAMWVCVAPGVDGVAKRGRPPGTRDTLGVRRVKVDPSSLVAVDSSELGDDVLTAARKVLELDASIEADKAAE
jgi:hypothetical protein